MIEEKRTETATETGEETLRRLEAELAEARETLRALRRGEVDALIVGEPGHEQVYTLSSAERPYRVMVEQMKEGAMTLSADGVILYANRRLAKMVGEPLEQVIGRPLARFVAGGEALPAGLLAGEGDRVELTLRRSEGEPIPVTLSTTEVVAEGGRTYCAVVTDLTHQRHHERLRASERRLQEADRRKDEFLAMLGHELRNPLAPIAHAVEILRREQGSPSEERLEWALRLMERQLSHVSRLIDDLLDMGRITRGVVELRRRPTDLTEVVVSAVESSQPLIEERRHHLEVSLGSDPLWVDGDPTRLSQVVGNLLNNAAKYTPEGGRIELQLARRGQEAVLTVRDDGEGIAEDLLPQVFDLFTQGKAGLDRSGRGLGLGLTLVRRLVEMHGGEVTAASPGPGRGSTFEVRLPLIPVPPAVAEAGPEPVRRGEIAGERILIIDDNTDAADALALLLDDDGHETAVAYDGPGGLELAGSFRPTVVCLDLGLPQMSGYEVARRLRRRFGAGIYLIAVTGYGQAGDVERSHRAGFDQHLTKPVTLARLRRVLQGHRRPPG